jgi:hypothetical protein
MACRDRNTGPTDLWDRVFSKDAPLFSDRTPALRRALVTGTKVKRGWGKQTASFTVNETVFAILRKLRVVGRGKVICLIQKSPKKIYYSS